MRRIVVVTAGLSQPSSTRLLADQLADAVSTQISARGEAAQLDVIELRELAVPLATTMAAGGMPTEAVVRARELVSQADGMIAVTPVFTASYSGLFKMFFDVLDTQALAAMPVLIGATAGTARHSLVLDHAVRPMLTYLHAVVVPTGVFAATEDFGDGEEGRRLASRISRAASELAALVVAESGAVAGFAQDDLDGGAAAGQRRSRPSGNDLDDEVTDFESMLRSLGQS